MTQDTTAAISEWAASHWRWRQRRHEELAASDSWLGLIGLYWLEPGTNTVGSAPGSAVPMPAGPAHLGDLLWQGESVVWQPAEGSTVTVEAGEAQKGGDFRLRTDAHGEASASRVRYEKFVFFIIERDGRLAVRLRDQGWQARRPFAGVECFPFDSAWCIEAQWQPLPKSLTMEVPNVTGELKPVSVAWQAVFRIGEREYALLPLEVSETGIFFVFRDATSGKESYGGGRFLRAKPPVDGRVMLDFNRAYNPPCAFTPFATCPLPPPENWLPVAIRAGERKYTGNY